ncbi:hypothetical protein ACK1KB_07695 [Chryseobacterium sp. TY3]
MFLKSENMGSKKDDYKDHFNLKFNRRRDKFFNSNHPFRAAVGEKLSAHKTVNISESEAYFALLFFAGGLK